MSRRSKRLKSLKDAQGAARDAKSVPTPKSAVAVQPVELMDESVPVIYDDLPENVETVEEFSDESRSLSIAVAQKLLDMLAILAGRLAADIRNLVVGAPVPPPEGKSRKAPVPGCSLLVKSLNQLNKIANDNIRMLVKAEAPEMLVAERRLQAGNLLYSMGSALLDILAAEIALIGANPEPPTTEKFIKTLATLSRIVSNAERMREKAKKVRNAECGTRNEGPGATGEASASELARVAVEEGPAGGATHAGAAGEASTPELARVHSVEEGPMTIDGMDKMDGMDEMDEMLLTERADRP